MRDDELSSVRPRGEYDKDKGMVKEGQGRKGERGRRTEGQKERQRKKKKKKEK